MIWIPWRLQINFCFLYSQPGPFFSRCQHTEISVTFETAPFALILQNKHYRDTKEIEAPGKPQKRTLLSQLRKRHSPHMMCKHSHPRSPAGVEFPQADSGSMSLAVGGWRERKREGKGRGAGQTLIRSLMVTVCRVWELCSASWAIRLGRTRLRESHGLSCGLKK